jgi:hypothetical protein
MVGVDYVDIAVNKQDMMKFTSRGMMYPESPDTPMLLIYD